MSCQIFINYYMHLCVQYPPLVHDQEYHGNQIYTPHMLMPFLPCTNISPIIVQSCLDIGTL